MDRSPERTRRGALALGILACLLVAAILLVVARDRPPSSGDPAGGGRGGGAPTRVASVRSDPVSATDPGDGERSDAAGDSSAFDSVATGAVICASTGAPLPAAVAWGRSRASCDPATGAFELRVSGADARALLRVTCDGFEARDEEPPGAPIWDLGAVRLRPTAALDILVVDSTGRPVPGALVALAAATARDGRRRESEHLLGFTDREGTLRVALGTRETSIARDGPRTSAPLTLTPPFDRAARLVLADGVRLSLRDARTGGPVPELPLAAVAAGRPDRPRIDLRSGDDGLVDPPLPAGIWRLEMDGSRARFDLTSERSGYLAEDRAPGRVRIDLSPGEPTRILDLLTAPDPGCFLRIVDAKTHAPVGPASLWRALAVPPVDGHGGFAVLPRPWTVRPDDRGAYPIPPFWVEELDGTDRLVVSADGYARFELPAPAQAIRRSDPLVIPLARGKRRALLLCDACGRPWIGGAVEIVEDRTPRCRGFEGARSTPDATGRLEFTWCGGDVSLDRGGAEIARVRRELLENALEVQVRVEEGGRVLVVADPDVAADLAALPDGARSWIRPVRDDEGFRFFGLPPGDCLVGPVDLLRATPVRGGLAARPGGAPEAVRRVAVAAGEETRISFDPRWTSVGDITVTVDAVGIAPAELFCVPWFGPPDAIAPFGSVVDRHPVDPNGTCTIAGLSAEPRAVVVGRNDRAGRFVPLALCDAARRAEVRCADLELALLLPPGEAEAAVEYTPRIEGIRYTGLVTLRGRGGSVPVRAIPVGTHRLTVRAGDREVTVSLQLTAGHRARYTADLR